MAVSGFGIVASSSLGILLRFCAARISPCLIFHSFADRILAEELINHQCRGWMSGARCDPLRKRISSPLHQALPFGALGMTRWKSVSPVQVNVLPSTGWSKDFASWLRPAQQSSTVAISGQISPENLGLVTLRTSMCLTSMGGGSEGTSNGLNRVVRGRMCRRTRSSSTMTSITDGMACLATGGCS